MAKLIEITGKALSGEWGTDDEIGNGIPVLRTTNFTNEGFIDYRDVVTRHIDKKNIDEKYLRPGDIIIEKSGGSDKQPVGRVVYFEGPESTYMFNNFTGLLRVKEQKKWFPKYIFYSLYYNYYKGGTKIYENKTTGLHNLKMDSYISRYDVLEKDYGEQIRICERIDKINRLIQLHKEEIIELEKITKSRFVELFVGKNYDIVKAGSIIKEMRNGVSPSTSGGHFEKVLTLSAITQGKFDDKAWKEGFFTDCPSTEKRITEDDFYICRGNGNKSLVGMGVYALENRPDLVFPDTVIAAHIDTERMVLPYLWIMWQQPEVRKQLESGARTTNGTYKINQKVISEIKIICPPINEQEVFADFIKQVDKSKSVIQKSLDELEILKKSLMQKYFG